MDIPTHGLMAAVLADGFFRDRPALAACFVLGSISPDLDLLVRLRGAAAFLRVHQTVTHSLPTILTLGLVPSLVCSVWAPEWTAFFPVFAAGMLFHSLLDTTNTFGLQLLAPLVRERYCTEWLFCVDAFVTLASGGALIAMRAGPPGWATFITLAYVATMAAYWALRAWLRARARERAPVGTVSLIPTSLWPWIFLGCSRRGETVSTFELNLATGACTRERDWALLDARYGATLERLPEYRAMRALSPLYHVVSAKVVSAGAAPEGGRTERVVCKDLRIRNLRTRFGELTADIGPDGLARVVQFRV